MNSRSVGKRRRRFMTLLLGFIYYVVLCTREEICKENFGCKSRRDDMENLIVVRRITIEIRKARKLKHMWCVQSVIIHIFPIFRLHSPCTPNATIGFFVFSGGGGG